MIMKTNLNFHPLVERTRKNLVWLGKKTEVFVCDATRVSEKVSGLDAIVTEPDLGPKPDLEKLYFNCFFDWRKVLKPNGAVVIALPGINNNLDFVKNVIDKAKTIGYSLANGPYPYFRPQAVVRRNICVFKYGAY